MGEFNSKKASPVGGGPWAFRPVGGRSGPFISCLRRYCLFPVKECFLRLPCSHGMAPLSLDVFRPSHPVCTAVELHLLLPGISGFRLWSRLVSHGVRLRCGIHRSPSSAGGFALPSTLAKRKSAHLLAYVLRASFVENSSESRVASRWRKPWCVLTRWRARAHRQGLLFSK